MYRKIGGIHWISIGRLRVSICMKRRPVTVDLVRITEEQYRSLVDRGMADIVARKFRNHPYIDDETGEVVQ